MNVTTVFDRDRSLRTHTVSGIVNLRDFRTTLAGVYGAPDFDPDMNALWDLRQADFSHIMPEDVRALMHVVTSNWVRPGKCRCAILVASEIEYGVARIYESQFGRNAPCLIKVFLDMRDALPWFVGREENRIPIVPANLQP